MHLEPRHPPADRYPHVSINTAAKRVAFSSSTHSPLINNNKDEEDAISDLKVEGHYTALNPTAGPAPSLLYKSNIC